MNNPLSHLKQEITRAFAEWERRWREEPETFLNDMERLAQSTTSIAEQQTEYFLNLIAAGRAAEETQRQELLKETRVAQPDLVPYPLQFFKDVAAAYRVRVALGMNPGQQMAEEADVPASTAHRWIREARRRGYLGEAPRGRAGEQVLS